MGSQTPTYALPYPQGTDRVADGDNAIQALAEKVEATIKGPRNDDYSFTTVLTLAPGTNGGTWVSKLMNLPQAFAAPPAIVASMCAAADTPGYYVSVTLVTATQVKLRVDKLLGSAVTGNVPIQVAVSCRAPIAAVP